MSDSLAEVIGTAERAAAGSEADKRALAQLLNSVDLTDFATTEDRAYLAVLLDWLGMREQAMFALSPGKGGHYDYGAAMPNLAGTLTTGHGEYERARELFGQALSAAGGDTHVRVKILANLAALSLLAGEVRPASAWLVQARNTGGRPDDPAIDLLLASTEFGIMRAQSDLGGMRASISRLNETTRARIAQLGPDHQLALTAIASLAAAEFEVAAVEESAEGQERAIAVLEVAAHRLAADLGADHPQALTCLENMCVADFRLARASQSQDRASRAASMLEAVSQRTTAALGDEHPQAHVAAANAAAARMDLQGTGITTDVTLPLGMASPALEGDAVSKAHKHQVRTSPRSLPLDLVSFVGRTAELKWLRSQGAGSVTVVHGMPGVGKTTLAVHAAHEIKDRFPDGQLFLNLRGHTSSGVPLTSSEALRLLLIQLAVPSDTIPDTQVTRETLYQAILDGKRALLILDDASNAEQVLSLLPGSAGCATIITSRTSPLNVDVARALALGMFSEHDAVALIRTISATDASSISEEDAHEIATLCGHLPLALHLVAARLRSHSAKSVDDFLTGLRNPVTRLDRISDHGNSIAEAFRTSLRSLPSTEEQQFFGRLSLIPGPDFDAYVAACISATAYSPAQERLESLLFHNLLMQDKSGRYRFHDLVRRYASTLNVPDADQATENLLNYYLFTALLARRLIGHDLPAVSDVADTHVVRPSAVPSLQNSSQALEWLDAELANLDAVAQLAVKTGNRDIAVGLSEALADYLIYRGSPSDTALTLLSTGLQAAIETGDLSGQATALLTIGCTLADGGRYGEARETLLQALTVGRQLSDPQIVVRTLVELGRTARDVNEIEESRYAFATALDICRSIGDRRAEASCLFYLGDISFAVDDFVEAEKSFQVARALAAELGRPSLVATCQLALSRVHLATRHLSAAEEDLARALSAYRQLGHHQGTGATYALLGKVASMSGRYDEAEERLSQALAVFSQLDDAQGVADVHNDRAYVALRTGRIQEAREWYALALNIAQSLSSLATEADSFRGLAVTSQALGRTADAVQWYHQALVLYEQLGADSDVANIREALSKLGESPSEA